MATRAERNRKAMEQIDEVSIDIDDAADLNLIRQNKFDKASLPLSALIALFYCFGWEGVNFIIPHCPA